MALIILMKQVAKRSQKEGIHASVTDEAAEAALVDVTQSRARAIDIE